MKLVHIAKIYSLIGLITVAAYAAQAESYTYKCTYQSGDLDSSSGERVSKKMTLTVSDDEASLKGYIWGKFQTDSGALETDKSVKVKHSQVAFTGFSTIRDDNAGIDVFVDKTLVNGQSGGQMTIKLYGDQEDSVDLNYEYLCE